MSHKLCSAFLGGLAVSGLLICGGCGQNRPDTALVSGKLTFQGKPVATGRIVFHPVDGRRPAMAAINEDGTYQLTTFDTKDGAMLGEHVVTIKSTRTIGGTPLDEFAEAPPGAAPAEPPKLEWLVPEKYSRKDTTPLKATVKDGKNAIDFNLPLSE
ncbi:MAG: hypothetical protein GX594_16870 [Pirellulaceae bacterium]|nr:hypothetical protein [Pirellulaceae bacterium]